MLLEILVLLLTIILLLWLYIKRVYNYWNSCGIESVSAVFPYGSVKQCLLLRKTIGETLAEFYSTHKGKKLIGFYAPFKPMLLIRDPELIKTVIVKDFNNFHDNGFDICKHVDPLIGYNPFGVKGLQEWKQSRGIHTPVHSLVKTKNMIPDIAKVAVNFARYVSTKVGQPVDLKDAARLFTNDAVAVCAFGIESDSFFGGNASLKQYTNGELFGATSEGNYACLSSFFLPRIVGKTFRWRTMSAKAEKFFVEMAKSCMAYRKQNNVNRNDLIQHLMFLDEKAKKEQMKSFTDEELAANCMTFFIDGVETASVGLTFTLFEIAANLTIQNKLRDEIKTAVKEPTELDFDKLWSLSYLDMVVSEALRKYPPVNLLSRICTKETTLDGMKIQKGTKVFIPTLGIHMDPEYYPEPEKFLPERFSKEKRAEMNKFVYLPFGEGPRICVGSKFALAEIKMAVIALLLKFHLSLSKEISHKSSLGYDENCIFLIMPKGNVNIIFTPI